MKTTRRILALITVLALVLAMGTTAFAATITVDDAVNGESYDVYKIFDATTMDADKNSKVEENEPVSYTITKNDNAVWTAIIGTATPSAAGVYSAHGLTFTPTAHDPNVYVVEKTDAFAVDAFATFLKENVTSLGTAVVTLNQENSFTKDNLATGYYFVTSSLGSLCALATEDTVQTIKEKNSVPTLEKKVSDTGADNDWNTTENAQIGDTVYFKITVTDGIGTDNAITIYDTMSVGLTYTANSLKINNESIEDTVNNENYNVTVDGQNITIVLTAKFVEAPTDSTVITYSAVLNENAVAGTADTNEVYLTYSNQTSTKPSVTVKTYKFAVNKHATDATTNLADAVFSLKKDGDVVNLIKIDDTHYRVANGNEANAVTTFMTVASGNIEISGVDVDSDYTLLETSAPAGYNKLDAEVAVTVGADNATVVDVENQAGTVLPSTGGMGTTIFYVLGGLMVLGALVVLVTNKRMRAN